MKNFHSLFGATLCGAALLVGSAMAETRELRVYNWADYILPQTLKDFQQQSLK